MNLIPVEVEYEIPGTEGQEAYLTEDGIQVVKSVNKMSYGKEVHVSISRDEGFPSEECIAKIIAIFFGLRQGKVEIYKKLSSKPPPRYIVHVFGPAPGEDKEGIAG